MAPLASITDGTTRAFPAHPRRDRYFGSGSAEQCRHRLIECLARGEGPAVLLGAPGAGKSMLVEVVAAELEAVFRVVRLASAQLCTRRALLQSILHGLGLPYRDRDEGELRLALGEALRDRDLSETGVALLVDEAQALPVRLLEELRQLANTVDRGSLRLRLLLAGSHALDELLTDPALESLSQRLAARCYLEPLTRAETAEYVRAHLAAAGADPDRLLAPDAYEAIALASDGLPRLVNQVCDRALVMAVAAKRSRIDATAVSEAWSDLHQLAAPWHSPASAALAAAATPSAPLIEPADSTVEFGVLEDDDLGAVAMEDEVELGFTPASFGETPRGVYSADAALGRVADALAGAPASRDSDRPSDPDDDEPVAYACPTRPADPTTLPGSEPDEVEDDEEHAYGGGDPFDEAFDEEELVLDPFAALERVIPAAPVVESRSDSALGRAYRDLVDSPAADGARTAPQPRAGADDFDAAIRIAAESATNRSTEDDAVLIVEPDDRPTADATVRRQDDAQLFANLRQG